MNPDNDVPFSVMERTRHLYAQRAQFPLTGADRAIRRQVSRSWNVAFAQPYLTGGDGRVYSNLATPFRGMMNNQDLRARSNYKCPNAGRRRPGYAACDGSGIPTVSGDTRQTWRQSDYVNYRKGRQVLLLRNLEAYGTQNHNRISITHGYPVTVPPT